MLEDMNLLPSPTIIDVDERCTSYIPAFLRLVSEFSSKKLIIAFASTADESVLTPLLYRLTSVLDLPILLIGGHTIGSIPEIRYLHQKGELARLISRAGGIVDGAKKKKGRKH